MGENDGSSGAAPSAQSDIDTDFGVQTGGFFARVIGALSPSEATVEEEAPTNPRPQAHGMINLRRMRVEDVAVPTADITAVPDTISLEELVDKFKESGLTRLPVFEGTLDTPNRIFNKASSILIFFKSFKLISSFFEIFLKTFLS